MRIPDTYQILGKIGSGQGGDVYKAYHKNLGKVVVLKKIHSEIKDVVNRRAEVDVLKKLKHPCLPQVLDFFEADGEVYTVMEFIPGNSFKQYLDAGTVFTQKSVEVWAKQICTTLDYLHRQEPPIIHGDLKPGNVMLTPEGNICLIDFNISLTIDGNSSWVFGYTKNYAAPEQISAMEYNRNELDRQNWKTVDARADIYSFGATIYHILSGKKPEAGKDGHVADIRAHNVQITDSFADILMKCLEPNPGRRYQNAGSLQKALSCMGQQDKRYKSLILRQRLSYALMILGIFLFGLLTLMGGWQRQIGKQSSYEDLLRQGNAYMETGEYEQAQIYYERAMELLPDELDAYFQTALGLYEQRNYGDTINYILGEILNQKKLTSNQNDLNHIYYLLGNAYEKVSDYEQAASSYEKAIELQPNNGDYYRDYAVALAYGDKTEAAQAALEEAKKQNINSVEINYVEGEILFTTQKDREAKEIFLRCIENTEDAYIKMRSYLMVCKCIDRMEDNVIGCEEKILLLEEARKELGKEYNIGILEQLAQAYDAMGQYTGEQEYQEKAVEVFKQIKGQGMGSYETDYNLAVLYQNMQNYSAALELFQEMEEQYSPDYRTYKGMAFIEVARQAKVENSLRDYQDFAAYYLKAKELYEENLDPHANDVEMDRLQELYEQAERNGWI